MAKIHGKNASFKLDNSAAALIDLSSYTDSDEIELSVDLEEVTAFQDGAEKNVVGIKHGKFSVSGAWDGAAAAIDAHLSGIYGLDATQTFETGPEGTATGKVRYTGECRLESYKVTVPVKGRVDWSAEFRADGTVTRNTF